MTGRVRGMLPVPAVPGLAGPAAGSRPAPARRRRFSGLLAALGILCLVGCGYRLQADTGDRLGDPAVVIDLRPFANASLFPDGGAYLAGRLREEMVRTGFRGSFARSGAEFLVEGTVKEAREEVVSHGTDQFGLEYRLTLVVDIRVVEVTHGRLLWKEEGLVEWAPYFAGADFQYTEANRRMAFEEACRRMARKIGQSLRVIL